jgi:hypothetical protein
VLWPSDPIVAFFLVFQVLFLHLRRRFVIKSHRPCYTFLG